MKRSYSEFKELKRSFSYAFKGLFYCIKNERNVRVHIVVALFIFVFSLFFKLKDSEYAILILTFGMVIFCEILNTAIETLVNLNSPAYNSLAKVAKDVAAGGVFLSSLVAIIVGLFLFGKTDRLISTFVEIFKDWKNIVLFLSILLFGALFIFKSFKYKISDKVVGVDEVKIYKPKKNNRYNFKY